MQKLSGLRSLEGFRSLAGSTSSAMKAANPRPSPDTGGGSYGSFANLKITAEKLVKEQASVKTDLEMAHIKLRRATEQINLLEGKLQQAVNENAKLKVKQTEDSKLWQGLDSKISSTKTLCDQLTETLQQLASQTEQAEEDKKFFEDMLGKNSKALDEFNSLSHDLSTKLEYAEQKIMSGRQEMLQIKQEKEEMDRSYKERLYSNDTTMREKDSLIKQLESSVDENKSRLICLDSRLQCMEQDLKLKDDVCISLKGNLASSESVKNRLELMNRGHILEIEKLCQNNKDLKELLSSFMAKVTELGKEHASVSSHVSRLISSFEMSQEEKMLMARSSKDKFEHLQSQYVDLTSENNALKIQIEELKSRVIELQKTQEIVMVQHVEECQVAEDKIRRLESEAEVSASSINQLEKLAAELQGRIQKLLEDSTLAENHKQELLQKILKLESDNQELLGKVQSITEEKSNNAESLQGERIKHDQQVDTLENQINQFRSVLDEKEQLYRCSVEREKTLEDQKLEVEASLSATECQLSEAKKQYDLMLEGKQIELSKHLKELSLKNDQAINEIRKKYELEKTEVTNAKKEKAEKLIREIENKCNEKISENKQDSDRYLICLKEKHGAMTSVQEQPQIIQQMPHSVRRSSRLRKVNLPPLDSVTSTSRVRWSETHTLLLYEYCVEEVQNLGKLSSDSYQKITQKLNATGGNYNIKSVKEKVRAAMRQYNFWTEKVNNPQARKTDTRWKKQTYANRFLKDAPPQHLNLLQKIFEPREEVEKDEDWVEALIHDLKRVCIIDELEREHVNQRKKEEVDDINVECKEQLESVYRLALAAAKKNPSDSLIREAAKARYALAAIVLGSESEGQPSSSQERQPRNWPTHEFPPQPRGEYEMETGAHLMDFTDGIEKLRGNMSAEHDRAYNSLHSDQSVTPGNPGLSRRSASSSGGSGRGFIPLEPELLFPLGSGRSKMGQRSSARSLGNLDPVKEDSPLGQDLRDFKMKRLSDYAPTPETEPTQTPYERHSNPMDKVTETIQFFGNL